MDEEKNLEQEINVANEVVATIAGMAVSKIDGVAKMAGGFTEGLKAISGKKQMSRGIKVEADGDIVKNRNKHYRKIWRKYKRSRKEHSN